MGLPEAIADSTLLAHLNVSACKTLTALPDSIGG